MSPRDVTFTKETVLESAVSLVREKGWDSLTARGIAERLGASVAPVYSSFGSMEEIQKEVLEEARCRLNERTTRDYTEGSFLNIGVGVVTFARDEAHLFSALFHTRHQYPDVLERFDSSVIGRMKGDPMLRLLPDASLRRLLDNIWLYTLGLATSIVYGQLTDPSTEAIVRSLKSAGNMMIFAELAGIADCESESNEREWTRLLKEKNIVLPAPGTAARSVDHGHQKSERNS